MTADEKLIREYKQYQEKVAREGHHSLFKSFTCISTTQELSVKIYPEGDFEATASIIPKILAVGMVLLALLFLLIGLLDQNALIMSIVVCIALIPMAYFQYNYKPEVTLIQINKQGIGINKSALYWNSIVNTYIHEVNTGKETKRYLLIEHTEGVIRCPLSSLNKSYRNIASAIEYFKARKEL